MRQKKARGSVRMRELGYSQVVVWFTPSERDRIKTRYPDMTLGRAVADMVQGMIYQAPVKTPAKTRKKGGGK